MEIWFIIVVSLCLLLLTKAFIDLLYVDLRSNGKSKSRLPPGITISSFAWLLKYPSFHGPLRLVKHLRSKFGPIFTVYVGSRPTIWIADPSLAYQALIKNGAKTVDRFVAHPTHRIFNSNQHNVSSASYGPTWQALRRNLASHFLNPTRLSSFAEARKWALGVVIDQLNTESKSGKPIQVRDHFLQAIFGLQCAMCFGLSLDKTQVREVQSISRKILLGLPQFSILNAWPRVTKVLLPGRWTEIHNLRKRLDDVFLHLLRARKENIRNENNTQPETERVQYCYVDSLLEVQIPNEEGGLRGLTEGEIVSLCNEFLNASTDLPSTNLEWALANLVKYPHIQAKLVDEIKQVKGPNPGMIQDEELTQIPYLKALILEVLRVHPPGHLVIPHKVEQDIELGGYMVPKNASINVLVAEIGRDPNVWEDPMEFKPERFLNQSDDGRVNADFDVTGRKEIKMMPFGVGRRMCPGNVLARLNLEYLVANLVWHFEWKVVEHEDVDLSEKEVFTIMMKNPLTVHLSPRKFET